MSLRLGFARRRINPPLGMPMEGLGQKGGIASIHDDLYVRSLYVTQGDRRLLIVALDLLFFDRADSDRLLGALARALDLRPRQSLINFSHTHAGPRTSRWHYSGAPDPTYFSFVESQMVAASLAARQDLEPVACQVASTETPLPVSRRRLNADGQAEWGPAPDARVCRHLPVARFTRPDGSVKSAILSASCHPSIIYSLDVSAEFPGAAVRQLNARFGCEGVVYLQGAAGDTKPRQVVQDGRWEPGDWEDMEAAGRDLAGPIAALPESAWQAVTPDLDSVQLQLTLPLEAPPSAAALREIAAGAGDKAAWARDMLGILALHGALPAAVPMTLQGIRFGANLTLVALECELVGELGLLVLDVLADRPVVFPLSYSNGCQIYLPSDRQLPEHGYEVDSYWEYHWPAPLRSGIDAALRAALTTLQAQLGDG